MFIEHFFNAVASHPVLKNVPDFEDAEMRQDLTARITRILHSNNIEDLEIEQMALE